MTVKAVAVTMTATVRPWRRRTAGGSGRSEPQAGSWRPAAKEPLTGLLRWTRTTSSLTRRTCRAGSLTP